MRNVLTVLLAGGAGARLHPLTRNRAKPAVPFGGMYRIIDFTLSNCINSECRRIHVLVQYKSNSISRHIHSAWNIMHGELGEYIDVIPPQMCVNDNWYMGTADAIFQNLHFIERAAPREVLVLSGDHIYKMDYQKMVLRHRQMESDLTIATIEVPIEEAKDLGVLEVDLNGRIIGFAEKPTNPKPLPTNPDRALTSMGIYSFNYDVLKRVVIEDSELETRHDFGWDIIPRMLDEYAVYAFTFQDENKKDIAYWRDVGTIGAYWRANMDLVQVDPHFNLYDKAWPLRTNLPMLPPAKFVFATPGDRYGVAVDSIVSPGCILSGGMVTRSVLSPEVRIDSYAKVEESVLLNGCRIGRHAQVRRAIVEKHVDIPDHAVIGYNLKEDAKMHRVTSEGIVVVESMDRVRKLSSV